MTSKTRAVIAYITIIGWCVAYFSKGPNDDFSKYHLKQALGIDILALVYSVVASVLMSVMPFTGMILSLVGLVFLILMVFGIINACNNATKPVPVTGRVFEDKFDFIK